MELKNCDFCGYRCGYKYLIFILFYKNNFMIKICFLILKK